MDILVVRCVDLDGIAKVLGIEEGDVFQCINGKLIHGSLETYQQEKKICTEETVELIAVRENTKVIFNIPTKDKLGMLLAQEAVAVSPKMVEDIPTPSISISQVLNLFSYIILLGGFVSFVLVLKETNSFYLGMPVLFYTSLSALVLFGFSSIIRLLSDINSKLPAKIT